MLSIKATIEGDKKINVLMSRMIKGVSNFNEPLNKSVSYMKKEIQTQFNKEGGQFGYGSWDELNSKYKTAKSKKYPSKGILERTGKMKKSFQSFVTMSKGVIFNKTSYFKYHQSNKARSKMPRRVMMSIGNAQQKQIYAFFTKYLNKLRNG